MKPILKWVGGKRQIMNEIICRLPQEYNDYYEPFIGGASVVLAIRPQQNIYVNDINEELINVYKQIKRAPKLLIKELKQHKNESEYFYYIRSLDRDIDTFKKLTKVERASRIIFLNKTCYNGLYRVNSRGELNAPFGKYKNPLICDEENINNLSRYFNEAKFNFLNQDFSTFLSNCNENDFVYLDPPYDPVSTSASFTGYSSSGFSRNDQIRLKDVCDDLNRRGVLFMLSNSNTEFIRELYNDYNIDIIEAKRSINSNSEKRGPVEEVIIRNYE